MDKIDIMLLQVQNDMKNAIVEKNHWDEIFKNKTEEYKALNRIKQLQVDDPETYNAFIKEQEADDKWLVENLLDMDIPRTERLKKRLKEKD